MKKVIFFLCALALVASAAYADVPAPDKCQTTADGQQRILMIPWSPGGDPAVNQASFTVTVRNAANNPINNAVVEVVIGGQVDLKTKLCASAVVTRNTNASGVASFNIGGGGCVKGANAAVIRANGVEIRNWGVATSPDYAGNDNNGMANLWSLSLTLADFTALSQAFGVPGPSCHDYDNSGGDEGLGDFTVFSQSWMGNTRDCP